ncbi:Uncharacterised protein [Lederbergia lenta]|uniref:Uncharacterized protein n=1 Tax=Lederbergia lenta TaxID=1467 RepID=A0A2X4WED0_LEDLE|nr:Uncharacterised protein [Lederbergia lenta]
MNVEKCEENVNIIVALIEIVTLKVEDVETIAT